MTQRFFFPSLMGPNLDSKSEDLPSTDVVLSSENDNGYSNAGLEITNDFVGVANRELINRELVNLENAVLNIDNSNDVIIGPVTQFNVNGNVTIYQNKDGQPVGVEEKAEISTETYKDVAPKAHKEDQEVAFSARKKCTLRIYLIGAILLLLLIATAVILVFLLRNPQEQVEPQQDAINLNGSTHQLIPKKIWNGRKAVKITEMKTPVNLVIVKHSAGGICETFQACAKKMQTLQAEDISNNNLDDIYFSFAVGGDGNVYEGRGWTAQPASSKDCIDLVFLGNFAFDPFTQTMIDAAKSFLKFGEEKNLLSKDYKLINHNQTMATLSPGKNIIVEVKKWPHYDPTSYLGNPLLI